MRVSLGLDSAWRWLVRALLSLWVDATVKPDTAAEMLRARPRPVCYVLERESQTDRAVLNSICGALKLPRPTRKLSANGRRLERAFFELERRAGFVGNRVDPRSPGLLTQLVTAAKQDACFDVDFIPVAIFWGRAPNKEPVWWRLPFSENWALAGHTRKFLTVALNGRNTVVHFGEPLRLRDVLDNDISGPVAVRRVMRSLRGTLRAQRASTIGPDLSHRRTIVAQVLRSRQVRRVVRLETAGRPKQRRVVLLRAQKIAVEIAANYSQPFVTFAALVLAKLWTRLYDGVEFEHVEKLREAGVDAELIYVPCHRSHMDYLLLSYVLYRKGFAMPHVAAGANLDLPIVGRFLRKGGAFFLRRSFKGDALYAAVFAKYLGVMMARGHSLEYFIEGGRSRTGRLLAPRTGMLTMTVRSYLNDPRRRPVFIPVYFGYERIVEGKTYLGELSGAPKQKETVLGLLKSLPALRSQFGKAHVNLGAPIELDRLLRARNPAWAGGPLDDDAIDTTWLRDSVADLAASVMQRINAAAAVTPINLVATAMLATPRQVLPETDLVRQLELYGRLLRAAPYAAEVTLSAATASQMVDYAIGMGYIERQPHELGMLVRMSSENAILATYYRNNILHLLAMPSLLACCFLNNSTLREADIQRLAWRVYPYIAEELFLRWREDEVPLLIREQLATFATLGLLKRSESGDSWSRPEASSAQSMQLSLLAQASLQTIERYYLAISVLARAGSGAMSVAALLQACHLMAQRMSLMYGLASPEFFDKALFRDFIEHLRRRQVISVAANGTLEFGAALGGVAADAQLVLSEQIRHSILQVTHA
jgi:glycerol-3-phosphate O-acyltransferase